MKMLLDWGLLTAGWSLVALVIGSLWIPRVLGWREKLAVLSPLMREMWWTYSAYVWGSHGFFAVLLLGHREWLMSGGSAAMAMTVFMLLWWVIRLGLQFFGFDLREVKNSPANRLAKHVLTLLFGGLVGVLGMLVCWNAGWIPEAP